MTINIKSLLFIFLFLVFSFSASSDEADKVKTVADDYETTKFEDEI